MENIFDTIFNSTLSTVADWFIMIGAALVTGLLMSFITSFRLRSSKRFFIMNALMPTAVAVVIALVNNNIGAGIAVAGVFALIRFRSAPGTAEEITNVFFTCCAGLAFGAGYIVYGAIFGIGISLLYILFIRLPLWNASTKGGERLLRITIPEDLCYEEEFEETFAHFTKEHELIKVKTANMGALFKLSYRIVLKNPKEGKTLIDELRTKNGNLEIMLEPFATQNDSL